MDARKRAHLEAAGFKVTTVAEFLGLSPQEEQLIEVRETLRGLLKSARAARGWTQARLAEKLGTQQQAVARLESGRSTSMDAMWAALGAYGLGAVEIGEAIAQAGRELEAEKSQERALPVLAPGAPPEAPGTTLRLLRGGAWTEAASSETALATRDGARDREAVQARADGARYEWQLLTGTG